MNTHNEIQEKIEFTKDDVTAIPKVIPAIITDISRESSHNLFPDAQSNPYPVLILTLENAKFGIKVSDNARIYEGEALTNNTKLGKIVLTYDEIKVGKEINISRNDKGFWKIFIPESMN